MNAVHEPPAAGDDVVLEAPAVLRMVWADPAYMAEHIAIWYLQRFGPRAAAAVERLRGRHPDADRQELERLVIDRQTRVAMTEGAFVGGPFIVLVPVAFCAALLAQAQMVFELAAVDGHDPNDRSRVSDVLVLLGAYGSTDEANAGLDAMARDPRERNGGRLPAGMRWNMIKRMAYLVGVLGTTDPDRSRLRATLGWTGVGVLFVVGLAVPLVWVPYMAYTSRRSTIRLGARARAYYAAELTGDAGVTVRTRQGVRIGGTTALVRTVLLVALPLVALVVALLGDISFGTGRLVDAGIALLLASALVTAGWLGYRWWRRRAAERRRDSPASGAVLEP